MTLRIVLTDATGMSALSGIFGNYLKSSNAQIQAAVTAAAASATAASDSAASASISASASAASAANSLGSANASAASAGAAATSETNAGNFANAAGGSAAAADSSAQSAAAASSNATTQAGNAAASALLAQDWATKTSGMVGGIDYSAKYYAAQAALSAASIALPIVASSGGTGRTSLTANAVLAGDGTNPVKQIGPGTNGQMLLGVTGDVPVFGNNPTITGGTVDNAVIGGSTPKAATFTGTTIRGTNPNLILDDNASGGYPEIIFKKNNVQQWGLYGDVSGAPAFYLIRYNASGSYVSTPWKVDWSTGVTTLEARPTWAGFTPYDTGNIVAIANGGTGASDAATARTNLGISSMAGKNRVVNGAMEIQQGGAAASYGTGTGGYGTVDCWKTANSSGAGTMAIGAVTAADENGVNKPYCYAQATAVMGAVTGTSNFLGLQTPLEGYNVYDLIGKQVTVSFTFRASVNGVYPIALRDSGSTYSCVATINHTTGTTAKRYSVTFPAIPAGANIPMSNAIGLTLSVGYVNTGTYQAAAANTWYNANYVTVPGCVNWGTVANNAIWLTDVQLEEGDHSTVFERLPLTVVLAACQRYFVQAVTCVARSYAPAAGAYYNTPVYYSMRAAPVATFLANGSVSNVSGNTLTVINGTCGRFEIISITTGDFYNLGATFRLDARL